MSFPTVPSAPLLLLATAIEAYSLLRHRYLRFLPRITGDLAMLQPGIWQVAAINMLYDDSLAKEIGYKAPITTLEGVCHSVLYFNQQIEAKLAKEVTAGKGGEVAPSSPSSVPKPPKVH
jgi:hypothetical protein